MGDATKAGVRAERAGAGAGMVGQELGGVEGSGYGRASERRGRGGGGFSASVARGVRARSRRPSGAPARAHAGGAGPPRGSRLGAANAARPLRLLRSIWRRRGSRLASRPAPRGAHAQRPAARPRNAFWRCLARRVSAAAHPRDPPSNSTPTSPSSLPDCPRKVLHALPSEREGGRQREREKVGMGSCSKCSTPSAGMGSGRDGGPDGPRPGASGAGEGGSGGAALR